MNFYMYIQLLLLHIKNIYTYGNTNKDNLEHRPDSQ